MPFNKSKKHKVTLETYGILDGIYCVIKELRYYHMAGPVMPTKRKLNRFDVRSIPGLQDLDRR
jgi:hypothetical protein